MAKRRETIGGIRAAYERSVTRAPEKRASSHASVLSGHGLFSRLYEKNAAYNRKARRITGYIGMQGSGGPADDLRFGLFRIRFSGCEVIATYNLLKYLGAWRDIRRIASDYERSGAILAGGFGVRPDSIAVYLRNVWADRDPSRNVSFFGRREAESYDRHFSSARAGILCFWNGASRWTIHTIMICPLKNGRIRAMNLYSNRLSADFSSIDSLLKSRTDPFYPIALITASEENAK